MKRAMERLTTDLSELQKLMEQLDPTSTDPDDQIALKIFTDLMHQRKNALSLLSKAVSCKEEVLWANA